VTSTQAQQKGKNVKRIDLYKQKLKAAKSELPMRQRQFNAAERHLRKTYQTIKLLEQKINVYMAKH
jgi:ubiquitin